MPTNRRAFLQQLTGLTAGFGTIAAALGSCNDEQKPADSTASDTAKKLFFTISLAEWSLNKQLFGNEMTNLDFPVVAKTKYGIDVVEYVNQFFKDKATDEKYLAELLKRCKDNGVSNHLILIDGEGGLGELDDQKRLQAVENHYKWVDAAKFLGCRTIRVNAHGVGDKAAVQQAAIDGLGRLCDYAEKENINIIVENHGGYSSDGQWLSAVMKGVGKSNIGTLPDFGNFCIKRGEGGICQEEYDRYKGTEELMPFAKGVSAKTYDFDENGNCIETDYNRILTIVKDAGFTGIIGIEYEGNQLSAEEGIKKTKALLEKVGAELS